jgi:hypothetical protein
MEFMERVGSKLAQSITPILQHSIPVLDLIPKTVLPKTLQGRCDKRICHVERSETALAGR